jgi:Family of unknown function (DUF6152)
MRTKHIGVLLGMILLIVAAPVFAHHGNSNFDIDKKLTLKATVTDWVWANPHCWLKFDATDDKGTVVHWIAETSNPADMTNLGGWSKQVFKPGDHVTVTLQPVKNGQPIGRVMQVVLANGQTLGTRIPGIFGPDVDAQTPGDSSKQ